VVHQGIVYYGISDTYQNGTSYTAEVVDFDLKQIAAQTNGYIVLRFNTKDGEEIQRKLSLPVEMAGGLQDIRVVPIRYQQGAVQEIVMMPTIDTQKNLAWTNALMAGVAFLLTFFLGLFAHRFANRKISQPDVEYVIERVD
jgi:predicted Abi (CAAX) family protease